MKQQKIAVGLAILGLTSGLLATANDASAAGCNGVVNPAVWGCAPWDNNNGPQFPNYKAPKSAQPAKPSKPAQPIAQTPKQPTIAPNAGTAGLVNRNGAGIVAAGAGNAVPKNGAGIVAAGAGNAVQKPGQ